MDLAFVVSLWREFFDVVVHGWVFLEKGLKSGDLLLCELLSFEEEVVLLELIVVYF